jgi:hypothetical protein
MPRSQILVEVAYVAMPETILGWYRRPIARKCDGSKHRSSPGRPRVALEVETLIVHIGHENGSPLRSDLGHPRQSRPSRFHQTVGDVLRRQGLRLRQNAVPLTAGRTSSPVYGRACTERFLSVQVLTWLCQLELYDSESHSLPLLLGSRNSQPVEGFDGVTADFGIRPNNGAADEPVGQDVQ